MGAAESKPESVQLSLDLPPSPNPFLNALFAHFAAQQRAGTPLPADLVAAVHDLSVSEQPFTKKSLDRSIEAFVLRDDDAVWIELAKGLVSQFPNLDANVRAKLVPSRIPEAVFWRRFLWRLQKKLRKSYDAERRVALQAIRRAAAVCAGVHQRLVEGQTLAKDDRSPVTVADYAAQAIVCETLAAAFPADPVIGEESAAALRANDALRATVVELANAAPGAPPLDAERVLAAIDRGGHAGGARGRHWALDPIDGTKGFIRGEQYAVCLALVEDGEVVLGVLGCPHLPYPSVDENQAQDDDDESPTQRGCILVAAVGAGAQMLPLSTDEFDNQADFGKIRVSNISDPSRARVTESVEAAHSSHSDANEISSILGIQVPPLRMDSQCKYAVVARGDASIYLRLPTRADYREKVWDHAAGCIIVHEAGGRVTDVRGKPLDFSRGRTLADNVGVVATNGLLHGAVLDAVRDVLYPLHSYNVDIEGRAPPSEAELARAIAQALGLDAESVHVEIAPDAGSADDSTYSSSDYSTDEDEDEDDEDEDEDDDGDDDADDK